MMRAACLVLVLLLAGCSQEAAAPDDDQPPLDVTSSTGGIRGVVVDQAIRPIEGASVQLQSGQQTTTDVDGLFQFTGLAPGAYFITAGHPLYGEVQQSVTVTAGDANPPLTKVQLVHLGDKAPYRSTLQFSGFIVCSLGVSIIYSEECGEGVGLPTGDRVGKNENNHIRFDFQVDGPHIESIIAEQIWEPQTDAARELLTLMATEWACDPGCGGNGLGSGKGESPLYIRADGAPIQGPAEDPETVYTTYSLADNDVAEVNVALEQPFELFVTLFYNAPAEEGWTFLA